MYEFEQIQIFKQINEIAYNIQMINEINTYYFICIGIPFGTYMLKKFLKTVPKKAAIHFE